jgi:hypothetical protein
MICGNSQSLNHIHFQLRKLLEVLKGRAALYLRLIADKEMQRCGVGCILSDNAKPHRKKSPMRTASNRSFDKTQPRTDGAKLSSSVSVVTF